VQRLNNLESLFLPINSFEDPLINTLVLIPQSRFESEHCSFLGVHDGDSTGDGFEESNRAKIGFDMVIVFVTFFL